MMRLIFQIFYDPILIPMDLRAPNLCSTYRDRKDPREKDMRYRSKILSQHHALISDAEYRLYDTPVLGFGHPLLDHFGVVSNEKNIEDFEFMMYHDCDTYINPTAPSIFDHALPGKISFAGHPMTNAGYWFDMGVFVFSREASRVFTPWIRRRLEELKGSVKWPTDRPIMREFFLDGHQDMFHAMGMEWDRAHPSEMIDPVYIIHAGGGKHKHNETDRRFMYRKVFHDLSLDWVKEVSASTNGDL